LREEIKPGGSGTPSPQKRKTRLAPLSLALSCLYPSSPRLRVKLCFSWDADQSWGANPATRDAISRVRVFSLLHNLQNGVF
jgi:hypothetical protein